MIVDTTVAEKNVAWPTDAKLINKARVRLVKQARAAGLALRQSYVRVGKKALIQHQRYAHAKQFKRAGNYLAHVQGDAINPILAAAGYNFRLILKWIRVLWL